MNGLGAALLAPDTPSVKILTSDVYEWVPGGSSSFTRRMGGWEQ
jgi:hypothetical protein